MASSYTSLLGLVLPVTGELSGNWGDVWNDSGTSLIDAAISGTTSLTTDADVTLTTTDGVANQARQAIILWNPASGTVTRNITAPAQSKIYTVINASGGTQSIVFRGAGPTTGVTIIKGESAVVAWNGTDFIKVSNTGGGGSFTNVTISGTTTLSGLTASTALALDASKNVVSVTNTGTGNNVLATSPTLVTPTLGTPASATLTNATGLPISTGVSGLGTGVATFLATPSSANLAAAVSDETGTGALVFANSPTFVNPALGTPASGTVTNLTGTASININGTVGATTANTGAFTTLAASGAVTLSAGTANGVAYLNGSKVLTTGSALTFDGTNLLLGTTSVLNPVTNFRSFQVTGTNGGILDFGTNSTIYGRTSADSNGMNVEALGFTPIVFRTNLAEQMRLTSTGLGIGTSSPSTKLTVHAGADGDVGFFRGGGTRQVQIGTSSTAGYINTDNGSAGLELRTQGTARAYLDNSGNLGLGVTPSAWGSAFKSIDIGTSGTSLASSTNAGYMATVAFNNNSNWIYRSSTSRPTLYTQFDSSHQWYTAPSGTAGNAITFTQAMTLDASGQLQIGTTSNTGGARLEIVSNATSAITTRSSASGAGQTVMSIRAVDSGATEFANAQYNALSHAWRLSSGTAAMTLDASGNLGVGTTSPTAKLHVKGGNTNNLKVDNGGEQYTEVDWLNNGTVKALAYWDNTNTTFFMSAQAASSSLAFGTAATERARIDSSGNFIQSVPSTAPSLATNSQMVFNLTSNTNLRVSVRGSDGVTRTANITLA